MKRNRYLFSPGPVMVSERVHQAAMHEDMCHRVPDFEHVIANFSSKLLKVFGANNEYTIIPITGSGTAANEAVISSYFSPDKHALVVNNGQFGYRLEEMLEVYNIPKTVLTYDWGTKPNVAEIEAALKKNPKIDAVVLVFHESSTSIINPVKEIGELSHMYGKTFIVDGVSAVGGQDVNVTRDHIDFCTTSSNKCIASLPGVGIVCAKNTKLEGMKNNKPKNIYLNLYNQYLMLKKYGQTQNTPSTTMFFILNTAVEELLEEGVENRIKRYQMNSQVIRDGVREMGLKLMVDDKDASNTITHVCLPKEISVNDFIIKMEEMGYTLYPGKGHWKEANTFMIGNMGDIQIDTCEKFLKVFRNVYEEMKS